MLERLQKSRLNGTVLNGELDAIVRNIRARSAPLCIILFGSAVCDELTEASDIDIALIYEDFETAELGRVDVLSKGPLSAWPIDLLFVGKTDFEEKKKIGGVYAKIAEGKVLFP